jgi:hypothetical protein
MVEAAAARFRREGLTIPVRSCLWADLPAAIDQRFDVVLCTGNALVHAAGRDDRIEQHEHRVSFRPFTIDELRERLELAGLREVDTDYDETADRYDLITVLAG